MKIITIDWERVTFNNLSHIPEADFYFFIEKSRLIYLGISYSQLINDEINKTINDFSYNINNISIWVGRLNYSSSKVQRISRPLVEACECLLIHCNQPRDNSHCKKYYTKRDNLKVICQRTSYLHKWQKIQDSIIIIS